MSIPRFELCQVVFHPQKGQQGLILDVLVRPTEYHYLVSFGDPKIINDPLAFDEICPESSLTFVPRYRIIQEEERNEGVLWFEKLCAWGIF